MGPRHVDNGIGSYGCTESVSIELHVVLVQPGGVLSARWTRVFHLSYDEVVLLCDGARRRAVPQVGLDQAAPVDDGRREDAKVKDLLKRKADARLTTRVWAEQWCGRV